jgi:hypothetical protein
MWLLCDDVVVVTTAWGGGVKGRGAGAQTAVPYGVMRCGRDVKFTVHDMHQTRAKVGTVRVGRQVAFWAGCVSYGWMDGWMCYTLLAMQSMDRKGSYV